MKFYEQGDVLIKGVTEIPKELTKIKGTALQYGEHTGHAHRLENEDHELFANPDDIDRNGNGRKFLRLLKPTNLSHEEHDTITLPPGDYEVTIVREYDHFDQIIRDVAD